ncbi:hypothetical protein SteCoe_2907 [Stentor coeruleus]|uniref:non-specific serine/threonine protein kinase n=1 Tax=Stentor coeruleus TaxID=5963 RepID=A0A1R2CYD6_9CILI|nr:hypothetical protein SteCoe_2907 [Stentor coeruleus]
MASECILFISVSFISRLLFPDISHLLSNFLSNFLYQALTQATKITSNANSFNNEFTREFFQDQKIPTQPLSSNNPIEKFKFSHYFWLIPKNNIPYIDHTDFLLSHQALLFLIITAGIIGFIFGKLVSYLTSSSLFSYNIQKETPSPIFEAEEIIEKPIENFGLSYENTCKNNCYEKELEKDIKSMIDNSNFIRNFYEHDLIETKREDEVYTAKHVLDKQTYVIKKITLNMLKNKKLSENEIFKEIYSLKSLDSKYIARYLTSWLEEEEVQIGILYKKKLLLCIQTEVYTYKNLKEWLDLGIQNKKLCYKIFKQLVKGLKSIHESGLCHGDLKSKNVYLNRSKHVKISNFRLGKVGGNCVKDGQKEDILRLAGILIELFVIFRSKEERKNALERFRESLEIPQEIRDDYECVYEVLEGMVKGRNSVDVLNSILECHKFYDAI